MDREILDTMDASFRRCCADAAFLDRFYERFMASSPEVRERFEGTDFVRQKRALLASLHLILLAAEDEEKGPPRYLKDLAVRHSKQGLDIRPDLYDLWRESLLETVSEFDAHFDPEARRAWEKVLAVGISYLVSHYDQPPAGSPHPSGEMIGG